MDDEGLDVDDGVDADTTVEQVASDLDDQLELVAVMNDIADVSRRTYTLEQQRELSNTRGVFFGFLVSVAVIAAGWAPLVAMSWHERWVTGALTLATCLVSGLGYMLVLRRQKLQQQREKREDS